MSAEQQPARPKQRAFLAAYAQLGTVQAACALSEVGRRTHYDWLKDPKYAAAFERAKDSLADRLEAAVIKRALNGCTVSAFFMLKALRPEKFRENAKIEHTGAGGAPIEVAVKFVKAE